MEDRKDCRIETDCNESYARVALKAGTDGYSNDKERDILLWPNLVGSLLAPTTAKYGAEKKALAAASVVIFIG